MHWPKRLALCMLCILALCGGGQAQSPTPDEIIRALKPPEQPAEAPSRSLRGIRVVPSEQPKPPSIDLYVNFKFNSSEVDPASLTVLKSLSAALNSSELRQAKLLIIGHTDAKGGDDYNLLLSTKRSIAVRDLLISAFKVDGSKIIATGKGKSELKDASKPFDGINRRVEIRNVSF